MRKKAARGPNAINERPETHVIIPVTDAGHRLRVIFHYNLKRLIEGI